MTSIFSSQVLGVILVWIGALTCPQFLFYICYDVWNQLWPINVADADQTGFNSTRFGYSMLFLGIDSIITLLAINWVNNIGIFNTLSNLIGGGTNIINNEENDNMYIMNITDPDPKKSLNPYPPKKQKKQKKNKLFPVVVDGT